MPFWSLMVAKLKKMFPIAHVLFNMLLDIVVTDLLDATLYIVYCNICTFAFQYFGCRYYTLPMFHSSIVVCIY
jgi:hypothetical protein